MPSEIVRRESLSDYQFNTLVAGKAVEEESRQMEKARKQKGKR